MAKKASIAVCVLLLAYFVFTSGLVFEMVSSETLERVDMPYSMPLSGERTGVLGIYNEDDVACAKWIAKTERLSELPLYADYNGVALMLGYSWGTRKFVHQKPEGDHCLFLTSWNTRHNKLVRGSGPGMRKYNPLPERDKAIELYRRGEAVVYYISGD